MPDTNHPKPKSPTRTLDLKPAYGEMIKPAELIDIVGMGHLSLSARKLYNALIEHAFSPEMGEAGYEWTISLSELRRKHMGNERIEDDIVGLMRTVVVAKLPNGATRRVQLLGGNDMGTAERRRGHLTYSFDPKLVALLKNSTIFGKLEKAVILAFSSKYALSLYEAVARRVRLQHCFSEDFTIAEFRELLGVPYGKLSTFGNLNKYAIKPAVAEVNAMAAFGVEVLLKKDRNKVVGMSLGWWQKDEKDLKAAYAEVQRPRVGRKARIEGNVEEIALDVSETS